MASRRRWKFFAICASLAAIGSPFEQALADDDGAALFKKNCQTCHTVEKGGEKRQGPNLWAVIGRTAGSIAGFPYSNGLKHAKWPWTPEALDAWIEDPKAVFADSYMMYRQVDPVVRRKIITYLLTKAD